MSFIQSIIDKIRSLMGGTLSTSEMAVVLDKMAAEKSERLDWRNSIVDLLKLIGLDSSLRNRQTLAKELGVTGKDGSAEMNVALHKAVMAKLAEHGGAVPDSLKGA